MGSARNDDGNAADTAGKEAVFQFQKMRAAQPASAPPLWKGGTCDESLFWQTERLEPHDGRQPFQGRGFLVELFRLLDAVTGPLAGAGLLEASIHDLDGAKIENAGALGSFVRLAPAPYPALFPVTSVSNLLTSICASRSRD
jgi:hypothetical protein